MSWALGNAAQEARLIEGPQKEIYLATYALSDITGSHIVDLAHVP